MEEELRNILDKKLVGNDINISDMILDFLKEKCVFCYKKFLISGLHRTYSESRKYGNMYMCICCDCVNKYKYKRCNSCMTFVSKKIVI